MKGVRLPMRLWALRQPYAAELPRLCGKNSTYGFSTVSKLDETHNEGASGPDTSVTRHDHGPPAKPSGPPDLEASSMGTKGALNPPPGKNFGDDGLFAPPSQGDDPSAMPSASSTRTTPEDPTEAGASEASSMATGGAMNPPPGTSFDGAGKTAAGGPTGDATAGKAEGFAETVAGKVKAAASAVWSGTGKPEGSRGYCSQARQSPHAGGADMGGISTGPMPGPGENTEDPVDIGSVSATATGPNIIGGMPMKDPAQRMTSDSQVRRDVESMTPPTPAKAMRPGIEHAGSGNRYFSSWARAFSNEAGPQSADKAKDFTYEEKPKGGGEEKEEEEDKYDYKRSSEVHPAQDMPGGGAPDAKGLGVTPPGAKRLAYPGSAADAEGSERLGN